MKEETKTTVRRELRIFIKSIAIGLPVIAIIAALILFLAPVMNAAYTVDVEYLDVETYYQNIPYPVRVEVPLSYRVIQSIGEEGWNIDLGSYVEAIVQIENNDTSPGTFICDFTFTTLNRGFVDRDRCYILPGEVGILSGMADISWGEDWNWYYYIKPGTKTVTETGYKQAALQLEVIKTRPEIRYKRVTVFNYIRNY